MQGRARQGSRLLRIGALVAALAVASGVGAAAPAPAYADSSRQAQQEADQLQRQARASATGLSTAQSQLADLAARANAALDAYQRAAVTARAAQAQAVAAQGALATADAAAEAQQRLVGAYLVQVYRGGASDRVNLVIGMLDQRAPEQLLQAVGSLDLVGQRQSDMLTRLRAARLEQQQARAVAEQAAATAVHSLEAAAAAKKQADTLVAEQSRVIGDLQAQLDRVQGAAQSAAARAARLRHAEELARQRARAARTVGPVGSCAGGDVSGYANGHLPESALCPLWGAPGHRLRADAAAAFNAMSKAFAARFGTPICVTDSYRSYSEQQRVYAEKPGLAARPGTSNHGWGLATDLCGGIQNDGTATNTWMRQNSGRYSWFHPSWADPGGSGPYEPWHWEYAGGQ